MSTGRKHSSKFLAIALSLILAASAVPATTLTAYASSADDVVVCEEQESETETNPAEDEDGENPGSNPTEEEDTKPGPAIMVGAVSSITGNGTVNGSEVRFTPHTPLSWSPANAAIGRNSDNWWAGIKVTAPEGLTPEQFKHVQYQSENNWWSKGEETQWSGNKSFYDNNDGKKSSENSADWNLQMWLPVSPWYFEDFGSPLSCSWRFDWDNNGSWDQVVTVSIESPASFSYEGMGALFTRENGIVINGKATLDEALAVAESDSRFANIKVLKDATVNSIPEGVKLTVAKGATIAMEGYYYDEIKDSITVEDGGKVEAFYDVYVDGASGTGEYAAGDTVTLTVYPEENRHFAYWRIYTGNVNIKPSKANENEYTFVMPYGDVEIEAVYCGYAIIKNDDGTYVKGSGEYSITSDAPFDIFDSVYVDGREVDKANYKAESGSTIITFTADFMATLDEGTHTIQVFALVDSEDDIYDFAATTVTVVAASAGNDDGEGGVATPNTGDSSPIVPFAVATLLSGIAAAGVFAKKKLFA